VSIYYAFDFGVAKQLDFAQPIVYLVPTSFRKEYHAFRKVVESMTMCSASPSRRKFLGSVCLIIGGRCIADDQGTKKVNLIRLRPYHPTYVIAAFGEGGSKTGYTRVGMNHVVQAIQNNPAAEIEFVECYDDICQHCERRKPSPTGSVWGRHHTCPSAENPVVVKEVTEANRQVLNLLGLQFGAIISLKELVPLMRDRLPDIGKSGIKQIGGAGLQGRYEKGLKAVSAHLNI